MYKTLLLLLIKLFIKYNEIFGNSHSTVLILNSKNQRLSQTKFQRLTPHTILRKPIHDKAIFLSCWAHEKCLWVESRCLNHETCHKVRFFYLTTQLNPISIFSRFSLSVDTGLQQATLQTAFTVSTLAATLESRPLKLCKHSYMRSREQGFPSFIHQVLFASEEREQMQQNLKREWKQTPIHTVGTDH